MGSNESRVILIIKKQPKFKTNIFSKYNVYMLDRIYRIENYYRLNPRQTKNKIFLEKRYNKAV